MFYLILSTHIGNYIKTKDGHELYYRHNDYPNAMVYATKSYHHHNITHVRIKDDVIYTVLKYEYIPCKKEKEGYEVRFTRRSQSGYSYAIYQVKGYHNHIKSLDEAREELDNILKADEKETANYIDLTEKIRIRYEKELMERERNIKRFQHFDRQARIAFDKGELSYDQRTDPSFSTENLNT